MNFRIRELAPRRSIYEAIDDLKDAQTAQHILVLYHDLNSLREVYTKLTSYELSNPDHLVMLLPFYEGAEDVKIYLQERGVNVEKANRECSLVVADALKWFFYSGISIKSFLEMLAEDSIKTGKKSLTLLADMDCFFLKDKVEDLVDYELSLPPKSTLAVRVICCYNLGDFATLDIAEQEKLLTKHDKAISIYGLERVVDFEEAVADSVSEALSILGKDVSSVVKNYLSQKYSVKIENGAANNPAIISDALNLALDGGAKVVERKILRLLYQKIGSSFPSLSASAISADFEDRILEAKKAYETARKTLILGAKERSRE